MEKLLSRMIVLEKNMNATNEKRGVEHQMI
jgi:hypothetical protein